MAIYAVYAPGWDFASLTLPSSLGGVRDSPFLYRAWFAIVASFMARTKYYGIWTLTNASCILSGLSFNGLAAPAEGGSDLSARTRWNRCQNVDIAGVELAQNWKELLDHWNMNTNVWLRNNVYKRIAKPGRKPGFKSTMFTFMTSAFWHGIAPGYYVAFVLGGFCQSVARSLRKNLRPRVFRDPKQKGAVREIGSMGVGQIVYVALSIAAVHTTLSFAAMAFILLDVPTIMRAWASLYFYGIFLVVGLMVAFRFGLGKYLSGAKRVPAPPKAKRMVSGLSATGSESELDGGYLSTASMAGLPPADREAKRAALRSVRREMEDLDRQPNLPDVDVVMEELRKKAEELMRDLGGQTEGQTAEMANKAADVLAK